MDVEDWEEECVEWFGKGVNDGYVRECCESLNYMLVSILNMIGLLDWGTTVIYSMLIAEIDMLSKISKSIDNYGTSSSKADRVFVDFKQKAPIMLEVARGNIVEAKDGVGFVLENLERIYHSCVVPPQEKIRLYNKLKRQSKKVENHLRDASDGIKNAVATLRSVKSLEDIKNMTIYHEQLDYIFKATLEAIDALLDMKKALADFAKKYTVLPDNSPF
jgi:uncharacterized protein YpiB (UPF0302 family)